MSHGAYPQPLTLPDWIVIAIVLSPVAALWTWGIVRGHRARRALREAVRVDGLQLIALRQRWFRQGPFFWTATRNQIVYRVTARDASGRRRAGWARWGRTWLPQPDRLELEWDA